MLAFVSSPALISFQYVPGLINLTEFIAWLFRPHLSLNIPKHSVTRSHLQQPSKLGYSLENSVFLSKENGDRFRDTSGRLFCHERWTRNGIIIFRWPSARDSEADPPSFQHCWICLPKKSWNLAKHGEEALLKSSIFAEMWFSRNILQEMIMITQIWRKNIKRLAQDTYGPGSALLIQIICEKAYWCW